MRGHRVNGIGRAVGTLAATAAVEQASQQLQRAASDGQAGTPATTAIGHENGSVLMVFDAPIGYLTMEPEGAVEMAMVLLQNAKAAGFPGKLYLRIEMPEVEGESKSPDVEVTMDDSDKGGSDAA